MKKHLFALILFAALVSGCGNNTETQETEVVTETTEVTETDSVNTTEVDNTTVEIEEATAEVDSLLNEI